MTKSEEKGCRLCPRACGVNREKGQKGICGQTQVLKAARADLHMWEEPCISGSRGSGTIFFSGCNLHCVFCQNREIASGNTGIELSVERLADICLELQEKGANNIKITLMPSLISLPKSPTSIKPIGIFINSGILPYAP